MVYKMALSVKHKKALKKLNMKELRRILCENYGELLKEALDNKDWPTIAAITTEAYNKCPKDANVYYALAMMSHSEDTSFRVVEELIEKAESLTPRDPSITPLIKGQAIVVATQVKIRDIFVKNYSTEEEYTTEDMITSHKNKDFDKCIEIASNAFKNHPEEANSWYSVALVAPYTEYVDESDVVNIITIANNLSSEKDEYLKEKALKLLK